MKLFLLSHQIKKGKNGKLRDKRLKIRCKCKCMHICCVTSERHVHSYRIVTSAYFSRYALVYTGFLASLKMLDSFKLFEFYLRFSSGVGENSGTVLL